jgi:hypothetical protein
MAVLKDLPQKSHCQRWRISLPSTNSEDTGATIWSLQCGQRTGAAGADNAKGRPKAILVAVFTGFSSVVGTQDEFCGRLVAYRYFVLKSRFPAC